MSKCQDILANCAQTQNIIGFSFFFSSGIYVHINTHGGFCFIIKEELGWGGIFLDQRPVGETKKTTMRGLRDVYLLQASWTASCMC